MIVARVKYKGHPSSFIIDLLFLYGDIKQEEQQ